MKCGEIEQDLLLHGLGELPFWRAWRVALHVARCGPCRRTQQELMAASGRLGAALAPPGGTARIARPAVTVAQGWLAVASIALVTALLVAGGVAVSRMRSHPPSPAAQDVPCRPDLPNDKCR